MRLGRSAPPALVIPPDVVTVKGWPLAREKMPLICQPPSARSASRLAFVMYLLPFPRGSSYVPTNPKEWRLSVGVMSPSRLRSHGFNGVGTSPLAVSSVIFIACGHV